LCIARHREIGFSVERSAEQVTYGCNLLNELSAYPG
jgi:hypothetical protein